MFFDHIEQLKHKYTDQWVIVDASRPELKRFHGQNGRVKTVNMSGRALVEFDAYDNIGWYDIDPSCLTIVDAPVPSAESKTPTVPRKAPQDAPPAAQAGGAMNVADVLAAARGGSKAPTAPQPPAAETAESAPAKKSPAGRPSAGSGKSSVADILAAARKQGAGSATPPSPASENQGDAATTETAVAAADSPPTETESATRPSDTSRKTTLPTDVPSIVAMCREIDGG